jgi:hypothetical protein
MNSTTQTQREPEGHTPRKPLELHAAIRWRQYEAEIRVNTLRLVSIALFFSIHLVHYYSANNRFPWLEFLQMAEGASISKNSHYGITAIVVAWVMWAAIVHTCLTGRIFPWWLPYLSVGFDVLFLTAMLVLGRGAVSPIVAGYFLIIMMAGLRLELRLIWFATITVVMGYLFVLGCTRWPLGILTAQPLPAVPRYHQMMIVCFLILSGIIVGQIIRHFLRVVHNFSTVPNGSAES